MEWTTDVAAGDWIRARLDADDFGSTMHSVVPRGFRAYARIFHPAVRDRPVGVAWPPLPYARHRREWDAFSRTAPQIDDQRVSWSQTAAAFGTTMHAGAQWSRLVGLDPLAPDREDGPRDAAGWRYSDPPQGDLPADVVTAIARHLAVHTATPTDGFVAVWEGWGGLLGFMGELPSRTILQLGDAGGDSGLDRHNEMLGQAVTDRFNIVFLKKTWQPGLLSDDVSNGVRLELPARGHVLFRGGAAELAEPTWALDVPWREQDREGNGFDPIAQAPSLVWPDDHAWVLVTEVDYDSTIVGGSAALIAELCADPALEAMPIAEGADLRWDADRVNR